MAAMAMLAAMASTAHGAESASCERLGGQPMLEYQLFFGRSNVTDRQWADFVKQVVTQKLPDGFTAFDADGQWMNPRTRVISQERTKVIIVAVPDTDAARSAIDDIKSTYLHQFHQQSVGTTVHPTCGAF